MASAHEEFRKHLNDALRNGTAVAQITDDERISFRFPATNTEFVMPMHTSSLPELLDFYGKQNMTIGSRRETEEWIKRRSNKETLRKQNKLFIQTIHELSKERIKDNG